MGGAGLSDVHVLVVDDEPLAVMALRDVLEWRGLRVTTASDGEEALRVFQDSPADLLVTDLKMPRMDGATLIRRLRERDPYLPVIVMTGHGPPGGVAELQGSARGATRLLMKPISPLALMKDIEALVRKEQSFRCAPDAAASRSPCRPSGV